MILILLSLAGCALYAIILTFFYSYNNRVEYYNNMHNAWEQLYNKDATMFYYINDYKNYIQKIANLNFLIVGRYHSLCFALKTLTPFVALKSNSHKIEGMLEDIGMGQNRIIEENDIVKIKMKSFSDSEQTKILDYINTAPIKIENMFKEIKKLLEK